MENKKMQHISVATANSLTYFETPRYKASIEALRELSIDGFKLDLPAKPKSGILCHIWFCATQHLDHSDHYTVSPVIVAPRDEQSLAALRHFFKIESLRPFITQGLYVQGALRAKGTTQFSTATARQNQAAAALHACDQALKKPSSGIAHILGPQRPPEHKYETYITPGLLNTRA